MNVCSLRMVLRVVTEIAARMTRSSAGEDRYLFHLALELLETINNVNLFPLHLPLLDHLTNLLERSGLQLAV